MTRDEIVTALRCCAEGECHGCTIHNDKQRCQERVLDAAADLIENQQRHIDALMKANAGLRDTVLRRDAQIADMSQGLAQFARRRRTMERLTKRLDDGQAVMRCEDCKASWMRKHGKPMEECTAMYCRNMCKDRLAAYEDTGYTPKYREQFLAWLKLSEEEK